MAKDKIRLEIVSPEGITYEGEVDQVTIPTYQGLITVLPHHVPLFTKLNEGEIEIKNDGKSMGIVIAGGFLEIKSESMHILSDYAIRAESIEQAKALERKRKAEERLHQKVSNEDFTLAEKDLRMSILELKVAEKFKKRQRV